MQVLKPCGLPVEPEADPAEHHDEGAGQVDLDEEVAGVALQQEHNLHTAQYSIIFLSGKHIQ